MRLLAIDQRDGSEHAYTLQNRPEWFDLDSRALLTINGNRHGLRVNEKAGNVWITDLGAKERIYLANELLPLHSPWAWQANQELRFGPYILLWQPSRPLQPGVQPQWLAERVSPIAIALAVMLGITALLSLFLWRYSANREIAQTPEPAIWPGISFVPAAATAVPTSVLMAPTNTISIAPTPILTATITDIRPTNTPLPTATRSITEAMELIGAAAVVDGTPVINAHTMRPNKEQWDAQLMDELSIAYQPAVVAIGAQFWRLTGIQWLDETASQGMHHVFVEVLDETGARVLEPVTMTMAWSTGACTRYMENTPPLQIGERQFPPYGMNCPMYSGGTVYAVSISGFGLPSDVVRNLGLGMPGYFRNWTNPTSFLLTFQRTTRTE